MHPSQTILLLLAGAASASLTATQAQAEVHRLHRDHVLGTSLDLTAVGGSAEAAGAALTAALAEIGRLDALLSGWREDSELAALNRGGVVEASPELYAVVEAAEDWRLRSGGAFDPRLGGVEALWRAAADRQAHPDDGALSLAAAAARAGRIVLDPATRRIERGEGVTLGLDGVAKGYVIDRALAAARVAAPTLRGLMIDIGGDLAVWGDGPSGAWKIAAADPRRPEDNGTPAAALHLTGGAVATSGRGARDLSVEGRRIGLRFSPETGHPAEGVSSATVFAPCALDADALATALSVMEPRAAMQLVERTPGAEALVLAADGRRHLSSGWNSVAADPPARVIRTGAPASDRGPAWPSGFVVAIDYELPKPEGRRIYSPYLSIWITDASNRLVRQLLLQGDDFNYIDQNYIWWRRFGRGIPEIVDAVSRPTRPAGRYTQVWDGKDQNGVAVGQGRFTIHIEAIREHGLHTYQSIPLDLGVQPAEGQAAGGEELSVSRARYGRRS